MHQHNTFTKCYPLFNTANYNYIYIYIYNIINYVCLWIVCSLISINTFAQNHIDVQLANEYLLKGDKKKAIELYRDLSKNEANVPLIHNNYLNVLLDGGAFDEAQNYLKRIIRKEPENILYRLDVGLVY